MTNAVSSVVFYSLALVTLGSALGVVLLKNVLHSALLLGLSLLGVAGLYAAMGADFLFAAQILIYVGGIAVLILFVVLLSGRASDLHSRQVNDQWLAGLLVCGVIFYALWRFLKPLASVCGPAVASSTTLPLARVLLSDYAVPFELVSVILLAALAGAVIFSLSEPDS